MFFFSHDTKADLFTFPSAYYWSFYKHDSTATEYTLNWTFSATGQAWFSPLGGSSDTRRRWQTRSTDHRWPDATSKQQNHQSTAVIIKRQDLIDEKKKKKTRTTPFLNAHSKAARNTCVWLNQMWEQWTLVHAVSWEEGGSGDRLEKLHSAATLVITWGQGTHTDRPQDFP